MWCSLGCSHGYLCLGRGLVSFGTPSLPLPGLWEGCGLFLLSPGSGRDFIWLVCLLACMWGLVLVCISSARGVGVTLFGWVCMLACIWVCISSAQGVGLVYLVGFLVGIW